MAPTNLAREEKIAKLKTSLQKIIDGLPDKETAITQVNTLEWAEVKRFHSNGPGGSFTFYIKADVPREPDKPAIIAITTKFK